MSTKTNNQHSSIINTPIKRHYAESRLGQIHLRSLNLGLSSDNRPLVLLHPMPYSGLYYTTIMPMLAEHRTVIAIDYPGCGNSDALPNSPTIQDYALATIDSLTDLGLQGECDFLGFHTGCLVASELAVAYPSRTASITLIDIPFFDDETAQKYTQAQTSHRDYGADLECMQKHWDSDVKPRVGVVPIERAVAIFTDHINAQGDGADGFRAAFNYPCEDKFKAIEKPTLVIATSSSLRDGTLSAATIISQAELLELPEITSVAFETGAVVIADKVTKWL